ncbi:class I SAM-dependent methyltransferase [Paraburkholderia sp. NMBU_R16]|nr:class I SAM-dependent methyltransferase [Paraburkholderia sp. NMBU_R16]
MFHHLEQAGVLKEESRGLGFGVGQERMPSVFASCGAAIVATDAPPEIGVSSGWTETGQHSDSLGELYYPTLVDKDVFDAKVSHRFEDMNAISADLTGFDFTWSACCFEHLGSLEAGMQFVVNSLNTLKPGGVAVHTTEFNLSSNDDTIATGHTVLYRRRDMEELVSRLEKLGHEVSPFIVAPDSHFLDGYVDLPPYADEPSLKIKFGEFVTTSVGIVVRKRG